MCGCLVLLVLVAVVLAPIIWMLSQPVVLVLLLTTVLVGLVARTWTANRDQQKAAELKAGPDQGDRLNLISFWLAEAEQTPEGTARHDVAQNLADFNAEQLDLDRLTSRTRAWLRREL